MKRFLPLLLILPLLLFISCAAKLQTSNNNIVDIISSDKFYFVPTSNDPLNVVLKIENYLINKGYKITNSKDKAKYGIKLNYKESYDVFHYIFHSFSLRIVDIRTGDTVVNISSGNSLFEGTNSVIDRVCKIISEKFKIGESTHVVNNISSNIEFNNTDTTELPSPLEKPILIAVVDFSGNNVSVGDCRALTDRLRSELFNTKYFKVIEREMMDEIIKEQGFQQSGCSTNECMVEVGKLIGVEKIIGGSISQIGNVYSVSARIVNVETGEIETTGVYDHMGNIGELLTGGMKKVAYELIK